MTSSYNFVSIQRLVIENDELRRILRQHSILLPSPPTLRAKSRVITDGPMVCHLDVEILYIACIHSA